MRPWIYVAMVAAVAIVAVAVGVVRELPARLRLSLGVATALFVGGAVGFEVAGGQLCESGACDSWPYEATVVAEETLEVSGLALLLVSFVRVAQHRRISLSFSAKRSE